MNKKRLILIVHIAAWACFFLLPIVFFPRQRDGQSAISQTMIWMFITLDVYLVIFYYLNTQVMIPGLLVRKRWWWYALAIAVCLVLFILIPRLFEEALAAENPQRYRNRSGRSRYRLYPFTGGTAVFFLVFTVSTSVKLIQQWLSAEERQKIIETEKLNTELSFLKSQINPHFLFNTLNNIYSLAVVKSDHTAGAVMKLSNIMRYVLSDTKQHLVPLEKEIKFIQDFIDLQSVRLTDKMKIHFSVTGPVEGELIAPLIFIPFVENAFKFGISAKKDSEIIIKITVTEGEIQFYSDNRMLSVETDTERNNGIGLKNTKRRLEILFPQNHHLSIKKVDGHFIVELKISK